MAFKRSTWNIKGMNRDLSVSKFNAEFAYEIKNLRLTPDIDNSLLSWSTEKGVRKLETDKPIKGVALGQTVIDEDLIMFTHQETPEKKDYIYRINYDEPKLKVFTIFEGDLNFNLEYPIECLPYFENKELKKVYWVDGLNPFRFINTATKNTITNSNKINVASNISYGHSVKITKNYNIDNGIFPSGVVQYACTYYNNYGQESSIFYLSPIYYISDKDKAESPEKTSKCSFTLEFFNLNTSFDNIKIYSIIRTSIDSTPIIKNLTVLPINNSNNVKYIDTNTASAIVDPYYLLYVGSNEIIPNAISQKDNTLFLGNYKESNSFIPLELKNRFKDKDFDVFKISESCSIDTKYKKLKFGDYSGFYPYKIQLDKSSEEIKYFKKGEVYRIGIQLQNKIGKWSDVIYLGDYLNNNKIISNFLPYYNNTLHNYINPNEYKLPIGSLKVKTILDVLQEYKEDYIAVRPVVVFPSIYDRNILCQGLINPTVYNVERRLDKTSFVQSSWFIRPDYIEGNDSLDTDLSTGNVYKDTTYVGAVLENRHNTQLPVNKYKNCEIQCNIGIWENPTILRTVTKEKDIKDIVSYFNDLYYVDKSIVTFHSPELEFDESFYNLNLNNIKFRIVGIIPYTSNKGNYDIEVEDMQSLSFTNTNSNYYAKKTNHIFKGKGLTTTNLPFKLNNSFHKYIGTSINNSQYAFRTLVSGGFWDDLHNINQRQDDSSFDPKVDFLLYYQTMYPTMDKKRLDPYFYSYFAIYPFHKNGSINDFYDYDEKWFKFDKRYSELKTKKLYNYKYSYSTIYFNKVYNFIEDISNISLFNNINEEELIKIKKQANCYEEDLIYNANVDSVVVTPENTFDRALDPTGDCKYFNKKTYKINNKYPIYSTLDNKGVSSIYGDYKLVLPYIKDLFEYISNPEDRTDKEGFSAMYPNYGYKNNMGIKQELATNPVSLKYKSLNHAIIPLNYSKNENSGYDQIILPKLCKVNNTEILGTQFDSTVYIDYFNNNQELYWNDKIKGVKYDLLNIDNYIDFTSEDIYKYGYSYIGELYQDSIVNRFGGNDEIAISNNNWNICGQPVPLKIKDINNDLIDNSDSYIYWSEGDTFYMRYDMLKTTPYSDEDINQIIDVASFMCETRINLDYRYDNNRILDDYFYINKNNFNKLSNIGNQKNNYIPSIYSNSDVIKLNEFRHTVTWTLTKTAGELVDSWTNINLASTLDLDGDKGALNAIKLFNNQLFAFQDRGISVILYNENVQIQPVEGVPVEIANSGKVQGKRYISTNVGTKNKWSMADTKNGIYFVDEYNRSINLLAAELTNLSDTLGFYSWINSKDELKENWTSIFDKGFRTHKDVKHESILFTTKDEALEFSEKVNVFSSFFDYNKISYFEYLKGKQLLTYIDRNSETLLYEQNGSDANNIYINDRGEYYITLVANENPTTDKTFNNIEFRGDIFNSLTDTLIPEEYPFEYINVWNEYQKGYGTLSFNRGIPSNLKRKFRIWRINIPRDSSNNRNRIRNPWAFIKLGRKTHDGNRAIIHDIIVDYIE